MAADALRAAGWEVEDVSLKSSFDLRATKGTLVRQVEVKGTTGDGSAVLLTPNEVRLVRDNPTISLLAIVAGITLAPGPEGTVHAAGGTLTMIDPWVLDDHGTLHPTGYEYRLASAGPPITAPGTA